MISSPYQEGELDDDAEEGEEDAEGAIKDDDKGDGELESGEELEDGEISDEDEALKNERLEPKPVCRFFSKGQCTLGSSCRFLHPGALDKGNYSMFAAPRPILPGKPKEESQKKKKKKKVPAPVPCYSVRERIKLNFMTPVQVEAPMKAVGGKLTAAQLVAVRRRAATTLDPSVDGFRQSSVKLNPTKAPAASVSKGSKKVGKMSEELLYCPTRKRTNPSKVPSNKTVKKDITDDGDFEDILKRTCDYDLI